MLVPSPSCTPLVETLTAPEYPDALARVYCTPRSSLLLQFLLDSLLVTSQGRHLKGLPLIISRIQRHC